MMKSLASVLVRGGLNVLALDLLYFGERKSPNSDEGGTCADPVAPRLHIR